MYKTSLFEDEQQNRLTPTTEAWLQHWQWALNPKYARFLESKCPNGGADNLVLMDQASPAQFDNQYYRNLQDGGRLLGSDKLLYTDNRTRAMVDSLANSTAVFYQSFADAIVRLGHVGVRTCMFIPG